MNGISSMTGGMLFIGVCLVVCTATILSSLQQNSTKLFLVANREIGMVLGAFSVAVAWIWAPALFVSSQQAFVRGLPGVLWFAIPNALALVLFAFLAARMRRVMDEGYTLPEFIRNRLGRRNHIIYIIVIFIVQIYAVITQLTGSLLLLNLLTGLDKTTLVVALAALFLALASFRGIRSSLVTDVIKALAIMVVGFIVLPWTISASGGVASIAGGLGGVSGTATNVFDLTLIWTFGIPTTIALFSGIVIDQQQWQRAFSLRKPYIRASFLLGAALFVLVPFGLALLGFIVANPNHGIAVENPQLAGVTAVSHFLPVPAVLLFAMMILAALASAGSAALCAASSIGAIDIFRQYLKPEASEQQIIIASRLFMLIVVAVATGVALIPNIQIIYLLLLVGSFRAALLIPTILALFWKKLEASAAFYGMLSGIIFGVPLFIYGSLVQSAVIASFGSLVPIVLSTVICVLGSRAKQYEFNYQDLSSQYMLEGDQA